MGRIGYFCHFDNKVVMDKQIQVFLFIFPIFFSLIVLSFIVGKVFNIFRYIKGMLFDERYVVETRLENRETENENVEREVMDVINDMAD